MINRQNILSVALGLVFFSNAVWAEPNKIALVIGNQNYKEAPLRNPVNDAKDMKAALEKVGFKVIYAENASFDTMDAIRTEFISSLNKDSIGLFYYSGHGVQADGVNYLVPVDAKILTKADLTRRAYDLGYFLDDMRDAGNQANIIILDACRNNPFKSIRAIGTSKGLTAPSNVPAGSIIAYATSPNSVADDNPTGRNGIYTKYLKEYLFKPGLTIETALKEVRKAVNKENADQIPSETSYLTGDICLAGCNVSPIQTNPPLLSFVSGASSVEKNKTYTLKLKASDKDGDLSSIQIDWLDGSDVITQTAKNNQSLSFTHIFQTVGSYPLTAIAIDNVGNESTIFSKSVTVKDSTAKTIATVNSVRTSSDTIVQGNSLTFSATLSGTLPSGYNVKINYGNGLISMSGSGTNYSATKPMNTLGKQTFSIGIYDNKNVLQGVAFSGNFNVTAPALANHSPTLSISNADNSAITNAAYTVKLSAYDEDNNFNSIVMDWGDGASDSQNGNSGDTVTFTHNYDTAGAYSWKATAYDNDDLSADVTKKVTIAKPVSIPILNSINVLPNSVTQGNSQTFSATLNGALLDGYSVKVNYGNDLILMSGSGANYSLTKTINTLGQQLFTIGIYDSKNVLQGKTMSGNFEVTQPAPVNVAPTLSILSGETVANVGTAYNVQLQPNDTDNNLSSIYIDWGDGSNDSKTINNNAAVNFSHTYNHEGDFSWNATVYDAYNLNQTVSKTVTVSPVKSTKGDVETFVSGSKTFSYTKIANDGSELPKTAQLGTDAKDWACTKDNNTGLIWEVKTDDGGLRDMNNYYSNYSFDYPQCDDAAFSETGTCTELFSSGFTGKLGDSNNSDGFVTTVNNQSLCGANDWRLPTRDELIGLVYCSDDNYNVLTEDYLSQKGYGYSCASYETNNGNSLTATINATYFPNTPSDLFWSSSVAYASYDAWYVIFNVGGSDTYGKYGKGNVRLVRGQ